jgi:hypothetical protein
MLQKRKASARSTHAGRVYASCKKKQIATRIYAALYRGWLLPLLQQMHARELVADLCELCGVVSRLAAACSVVSVVWMCTCVYVCVCENAVAWVMARHISECGRVVGSGLVWV